MSTNCRRGLRRVTSMRLAAPCILGAVLLLAPLAGEAQRGTIAEQFINGQTITWFMPLQMAGVILQQRYGKVVTFEDTWREWAGEAEPGAPGTAGSNGLKRHSLTLPPEALPTDASAVLSLPAVQKVIDAYHQQNPMHSRFRVSESALGFHIIPSYVRGANGNLRAAENPLDVKIAVPNQSRTAWEHLEALTAATSAAAGVYVEPFDTFFDGYFAANGYRIPRNLDLQPEHRQYMVFNWGIAGVTAREALVDLLLRSCSTLTWNLQCTRSLPKSAGRACVLNILDVPVGDPPRSLIWDRCQSRPLPGQ